MGGYQRRVHGDSLLVTSRRSTKMMKTIAIVLLAAVAFAEPDAKPKADADPYLLYGGYYGHGLGYYGHGLGYGYDTTESVMLSQRLMLTPTFCMVDTTDTVLDTMDMVLDMDMDTMESVRLNQ